MKTSKLSKKQRPVIQKYKFVSTIDILEAVKRLINRTAKYRLLSKYELKIRLECMIGLIELKRKKKLVSN